MIQGTRKSSLAVKIAAVCVAVTMTTALVLSAVFIASARNIIEQQITERTTENIHSLRDQLTARLAEWGGLVTLAAISASYFITPEGADTDALLSLFTRIKETQPDVFDVYATSATHWLGPGGFAVFAGGWWPPAVGWVNYECPWFLTAKGSPGAVGFTEPYINAETGGLAISMAKTIYDPGGVTLGVVSADVDFALFNDLVDEKIFIPGQSMFLINREGRFITHPDPNAVLERNFFADLGLGQYRGGILGSSSFSTMDSDILLYSVFIPDVDWFLVSITPVSAIFAEVNRFVLNMVLIGIALLVVAALVSIAFTYKELTIPIRSIKNAAASLVGMDFSVDIKKTENDEIGDMQEAMIKIRDNLQKNIDDMKNAHLNDMRAQQEREASSKERMKAILDSSPMLCILYDEKGDILDVNREAENMFGISDRQVFAGNMNRFYPKTQPDGSDTLSKLAKVMEKCRIEGSVRYEWVYLHSDGTPLPTEEIVHRIAIDGRNHYIAYSRDLRAEYAAKEAEAAAQKRLQAMTDRLNGQLESQSAAITESSAAIEQLVANTRSVSNTLSKNAQNVKELQEASVVGHSGLNEVATDIKEIARESESLLEINSVMQNIASQTNLLSMNAAIEAAHAGDSGRGFAVVADEIRKLAESSSQQSKTIGGVLKKIKSSIDKITKSTDNVMNKFDAIDGGVKTVAEQEHGILNAMTEQSAGSTQIMQAIAQVNDITGQVKEDARQMVEAAAKLGV